MGCNLVCWWVWVLELILLFFGFNFFRMMTKQIVAEFCLYFCPKYVFMVEILIFSFIDQYSHWRGSCLSLYHAEIFD